MRKALGNNITLALNLVKGRNKIKYLNFVIKNT